MPSMGSFPRLVHAPMRSIVARPALMRGATVLLVTGICGCAPASSATRIALRVTPAVESSEPQQTMKPIAFAPVPRRPVSVPATVRISGHCYGTGLGRAALLVVNGVALGRRSDGTVDHAAAQRLLGRVDPGRIVSVEILKPEQASKRFGAGASHGAILFVMAPSRTSVQTGRR